MQSFGWLVPPKITPFEFARDVNVGDRVSVQCVVGTGDLPLTFTWLKDDVPIATSIRTDTNGSTVGGAIVASADAHANGKAKMASKIDHENPIAIRQNDEFTSALSISSLTRTQGGTYKCIVENNAAKEMHAAILRVNGNCTSMHEASVFTCLCVFVEHFVEFVE